MKITRVKYYLMVGPKMRIIRDEQEKKLNGWGRKNRKCKGKRTSSVVPLEHHIFTYCVYIMLYI